MKIYAGIGSRETPKATQANMRIIAKKLAMGGRILRSGHADGADNAFELGAIAANGRREIYLPWDGFNHAHINISHGYFGINWEMEQSIRLLVSEFHPNAANLTQGVMKMMMRNCHQILGFYLNKPCDYVLMWAPEFKKDRDGLICDCSGGTGFAVRMAYANKIPVYHLGVKEHLLKVATSIEVESLMNF